MGASRRPTWRMAAACGALVLGLGGVAVAAPQASRDSKQPDSSAAAQSLGGQHGGTDRHLPPVTDDMQLISSLEVTTNVDGIADLAVHKGYAYLMAWAGECLTPDNAQTNRGGVHIVDIRDPAKPVKTGFVPALPDTYHGEGAHAITVTTPNFNGDLLAVNNESCAPDDREGAGGIDLIDVTDPRNPKVLVQGFGDRGGEGELTGDAEQANSNHSVFIWDAGAKAYAVLVDNVELHDVDIFDITNPSAPVPVAEYDLVDFFGSQGIDIVDTSGLNDEAFHHDMIVRQEGNRFIMVASYWDAGYVQLDVTNPAAPVYIGDSTFGTADPFTGRTPPEGNGHQGEFSHDGRFFLAADEDFAPYRPESFEITTGPNAGAFDATEVNGGTSVAFLPDGALNGPVVYGGYGCDASDPVPERDSIPLTLDSGEEAIIVLQRGPAGDPDNTEEACFPGEKAANGAEAGWDAVLLVNRHLGDAESDSASCGSGGYPPGAQIVTLCTTHEAFHRLFGTTPQFDDGNPDNDDLYAPGDEAQEPDDADIGDVGEEVRATALFDSWGYAHLYRPGSGKWGTVDHYAIDESLDPRFAFGFGDLSIHEWATDPTEYLAYSAYYAGGLRTVSFGDGGIEEQGAFIAEGGSNFWGVEQFTGPDGERYIAGSDRDFGLVITRYTGPGAARPPACQDIAWATEQNTATRIQLSCTDANPQNRLTVSIARQPSNGTLSNLNAFEVTYTPRTGFRGVDTFTYQAFDGAATGRTAQVQVFVGPCARRIEGTPARDLLNGTGGGDAIFGRAGNDVIDGIQGGDCLAGEDGRDQLSGGEGDDSALGGDDGDRLFGESGDDVLRGGAARDHLRGSSGEDRVFGEAGNDFVSGGSNNDRVSGGSGRDAIRGEAGNDRLFGGSGNDSISTGQGSDRVSAGGGNDKIDAANGRRNRIRCGAGRDRVKADRNDRVGRDCEVVSRTRRTRG